MVEDKISLSVNLTNGTSAVLDDLGAYGELVALEDVAVAFEGGAFVELETTASETVLRIDSVDTVTTLFPQSGTETVTAVLRDAEGVELARESVEVEIRAAIPSTCPEELDLYQINYEIGPEVLGVEQPVTVQLPLNGISYRAYGRDEVRDSFFMDCTLAVSLARAAESLRRRDIYEVTDIGIYNYRCIGGGQPPGCTLSQHAMAKGIDIAGFTDIAGEHYSVEFDWLIDSTLGTCESGTREGKDAFLHGLICELKDRGVWNIVLTPNYNAAHRNHFHVDLKTGSDFIENIISIIDEGPHAH